MFLSTEQNENVESSIIYYKFMYKLNELFSELLGEKNSVYRDINKTIGGQLPIYQDIKDYLK